MADLSTHYKERKPEETVQLIKNFFESHNLTLKLSDVNESEAGTWYCRLDLFQDDYRIGGGNGKGMTKEYALASGYSEIYERFCNGMYFLPSLYWSKSVIDYNKKHYGYNFNADEKLITGEELLNSDSTISNFYNNITTDKTLALDIINFITDGQVIARPYKNINGKETLYLDPRVIIRIQHSLGMAAGNTETEALVQGLSEIVEKEAYGYIFKNLDKPVYALNLDKLDNPNLLTIISKIKALGYDLYLLDLSYSCNLPTMMSLLIDRNNGILRFNLGSFPVFDIAAERVLTELYQGISSFNTDGELAAVQVPYRIALEPDYFFKNNTNSFSGTIFPIDFLKNIKTVDTYNKEIFIDINSSNEECLNYFIKLSEKNNIKFYYLNNSLSADLAAVSIFVTGNTYYNNLDGFNYHYEEELQKDLLRKGMKQLSQIIDEIYTNKTIDIINFIDFINSQFYFDDIIGPDRCNITSMWHNFFISERLYADYYLLNQLANSNGDIEQIDFGIIYSPIYKQYKKFKMLQYYIRLEEYTKEEIYIIFNNYFNFNVTEEDIRNAFNISYLSLRVYIEPMKDYIHNDKYMNIIKIFTENNSSH